MYPSVAQLVERSTVVVDTVRGILRNRLVTSSILVVRTCPFAFVLILSYSIIRIRSALLFLFPFEKSLPHNTRQLAHVLHNGTVEEVRPL